MSGEIRRQSLPPEYRAVLNLRRKGVGFDQIAEELGYESRFEVIDILNRIYRNTRPINVEEIRDSIDSQLEDLNHVYFPPALEGNIKAANFVVKVLELKAKLRGAILPPQVNVQVNNQRPWEKVFATTLSNVDENGNILEGEVVPYDSEDETIGQGWEETYQDND